MKKYTAKVWNGGAVVGFSELIIPALLHDESTGI